jgi:hypothetical protein
VKVLLSSRDICCMNRSQISSTTKDKGGSATIEGTRRKDKLDYSLQNWRARTIDCNRTGRQHHTTEEVNSLCGVGKWSHNPRRKCDQLRMQNPANSPTRVFANQLSFTPAKTTNGRIQFVTNSKANRYYSGMAHRSRLMLSTDLDTASQRNLGALG